MIRREPAARWWGLAPFGPGPDDRLEAVALGSQPADLGVERQADIVLGRPVEQRRG